MSYFAKLRFNHNLSISVVHCIISEPGRIWLGVESGVSSPRICFRLRYRPTWQWLYLLTDHGLVWGSEKLLHVKVWILSLTLRWVWWLCIFKEIYSRTFELSRKLISHLLTWCGWSLNAQIITPFEAFLARLKGWKKDQSSMEKHCSKGRLADLEGDVTYPFAVTESRLTAWKGRWVNRDSTYLPFFIFSCGSHPQSTGLPAKYLPGFWQT